VTITVLALLLERVAERACGDIWRNILTGLKQLQLAQLLGQYREDWQVTQPTSEIAKRLKQFEIDAPALISEIT
jgi:hypothetical protein